jgi:hypothetical protein
MQHRLFLLTVALSASTLMADEEDRVLMSFDKPGNAKQWRICFGESKEQQAEVRKR